MTLAQQMQACEEYLLHSDFRERPQVLDSLLAAEFVEVAATGTIASRAEVLQWLQDKDPAARWEFSELQAVELAPGLRHVRYHARKLLPVPSTGKGSLHSSLWRYNDALRCWQLYFHQATRLP